MEAVEKKEGPCIEINQVDRIFGKKQVLFTIDLHIPHAQIFGILGPSGSGKTTLVKLIAGVDKASAGEVIVLGEKMPKLALLHRIGYMAQADSLYMELSAKENLEFFGSMFHMPRKKITERIEAVLGIVNLNAFAKAPVKSFSGGMKRRLSLATALIHEPAILILDEPTVGIDPILRQSIWEEIGRLRDAGTTIIVTTHMMDELEHCDQLGMIREGKLIAVGSPHELKQQANTNKIEDAFIYFVGEAQ